MPTDEIGDPPPATARRPAPAPVRDRIVQAAAGIIHRNGVTAMRIDQVLAASGSSRAQLYQHFPDRAAVIHAAVAHLVGELLSTQEAMLADLDTLSGLRSWAHTVIETSAGVQGVGLGLLVSELADHSEEMRKCLDQAIQVWAGYLAASLHRMQVRGELTADAELGKLAVGLLAALQGGLILAKTARDTSRLRAAMEMALAQVAEATRPTATPVLPPRPWRPPA